MKATVVLGAILTLILLAACQQNTAGQRPMESLPLPSPATSCDADNTCEMQNAQVTGNIGTLKLVVGNVMSIDEDEVTISKPISGGSTPYVQIDTFLTVNHGGKVGGNFEIDGNASIDGRVDVSGNVAVTGDVSSDTAHVDSGIATYWAVTSAAGEGNAYACFDNNGKLYRSLTPCR
ncbi:MAG: hypothetical protein V1735_01420 [Nanoarchaeota archaeon]